MSRRHDSFELDRCPAPGRLPLWVRLRALSVRTGALILAALILGLSGRTSSAVAQEVPGRHGDDATEIVLLGTVHFTAADLPGDGILSGERQRELRELADRLAGWQPDRFFVECSPDEQPALDSAYAAYRSGVLDLGDPPGRVGRGEIYQLGFRAAEAAGTGGVECMDAEVYLPGDRARQVAAEHNPALHQRYRRYLESEEAEESVLEGRTLREAFLQLNRDSVLYNPYYIYYHARMGSFDGSGAKIRRESDLSGRTFAAPFEIAERHMKQLREFIATVDGRLVDSVGPEADYVILLDEEAAAAESGPGTGADTLTVSGLQELVDRRSTTWVGFPDHHIGADMVAQWFKRNLRTYANIAHAVEEDDDRVILLIGQAHVWPLRRYFRDNPDFRVVPVEEVL